MNRLAFILLPLLLGVLAFYTGKDLKEYAAFKTLTDTQSRQRTYREWLTKSLALFGLGTLVSLALTGQLATLARPLPALADAVSGWLPQATPDFTNSLPVGLVGGALLGGVVWGIRSRRRKAETPVIVGDVQALLPRNAAERRWAAALALNAGLSEELFFRLLLPVLFYSVFGHALFALAASVLIFGFVHVYQGWTGVLATTMLGVALMGLYLATGSIWLVMGIHAFIDLNGLLFQPWLQNKFRARPARA